MRKSALGQCFFVLSQYPPRCRFHSLELSVVAIVKDQLADGRRLFLRQSLLPPPELLEECDSEVVTLVVMCAFDVEFNPLLKLLMDSVEIHHFFLK